MRATVVEAFSFDAAHHLPSMPEGHKCRRPHGHTWRLEVQVTGPVNPDTGMVIDYYDIGAAVHPLLGELDHHDLNEVLRLPTTENICEWLWWRLLGRLPRLSKLVLFEGVSSRCEYSGE
jgi:6-pyruvoyltetrahydropterin/6-carboxytetrahydropterin synthase